ncbi:aminotransferase [Salipiger sp. IMCC34102]|uniref:DegT/DnrJ/EryC1/StrS family aminotransferase n=1 Tax=Salipiger sp. IMCC34102 TaxID=2510647 RepID=UPI00101BAC6B|nr:aminotransferase class I/II-fold pyridoxal phosphate-dependent enzyme [Salipiger sp. IMCC34102]RYH03092.1 aminotransferase [Salipiger sp. IMCC34102]
MDDIFEGSFTEPEPLPEAAREAAMAVLGRGRLHRYTTVQGERAETVLLEEDFAARVGARYCLAVASGGYAIGAALRACGVGPGERVLTNAFTLAPVPGAIAALGAVPVYVGVTRDLVIDLDDLEAKLDRASVLLLSHMRGHICDMTRLMALCDAAGVRVIEDCAHTMGADWDGVPTGRWGAAGCFSTQTYKHVNSGEGGLLITDDADLAARAILLSGSYMLYDRHTAAPPAEAFADLRFEVPNVSGRMDNLRAAILRPQLADLDVAARRWNALHDAVAAGLAEVPGLYLPRRPAREGYVASSIQFLLPDHGPARIADVVARCAARGVALKWFGGDPAGYTARYDHWRYARAEPMPATDATLACLLDMRLPLRFDTDDCATIARIIRQEAAR